LQSYVRVALAHSAADAIDHNCGVTECPGRIAFFRCADRFFDLEAHRVEQSLGVVREVGARFVTALFGGEPAPQALQ
jgi:hypothetical protein